MDKFPEAFSRYTETQRPRERGVDTFQRLIADYGNWQSQKVRRVTRRQVKAMARVSDTIGISPVLPTRISYDRVLKDGSTRTISYTAYRDVNTGKFAKSPD
jgi:hypothetical protein